MSLSDDEALLNSDEMMENEEVEDFRDNSVTAIISDDSEEMEEEDEEDEEEDVPQGNAKAFSDKDNKWLKLKKNALESDEDEEEEEEEEDEEEMVQLLCLGFMDRTISRRKPRKRPRKSA